MYEEFVKERITQLRLKKGVSEYQMSYDLGHSRGYVYNISSGKVLPPLKEFFAICDYFEITPQQFFDTSSQHPELVQKALEGMEKLNESDMLMLLGLIVTHSDKYGWSHTSPSDNLLEFVLKYGLTDILLNRNEYTGVRITGTGTHSGAVGTTRPRTSSTRKYLCPCCGNSVRATKTVNIACLDCNQQMLEV